MTVDLVECKNLSASEDIYLLKRGGTWHYKRWVPEEYRLIESQPYIRRSLKTKSIHIARLRRDNMVRADNSYWSALSLEFAATGTLSASVKEVQHNHYKAATERALANGFVYKTAQELFEQNAVKEVMNRVDALKETTQGNQLPSRKASYALLGGIERPPLSEITTSEAFELYVSKIAFDSQHNKSPSQRKSWEKAKRTSINYFIEAVGDIDLQNMTRDHAIEYRNWWADRIKSGDDNGFHPLPYTANRHIGNMRTLYREYFAFKGEEDKRNPFRKISFKVDKVKQKKSKRPPFTDKWVRSNILRPGMFDTVNDDARNILFTVIETGARPSEICNLLPENIHLDASVPYIEITAKDNREVKATDSNREIPLVGMALAAMRKSPMGFPRYFDKETSFSAIANKALRSRQLLPTSNHKVYSFRHSFEDRMIEAGIDYGLRCILMGHKNDRPEYGTGGSLSYKRDELMKIAHPFPDGLVV